MILSVCFEPQGYLNASRRLIVECSRC